MAVVEHKMENKMRMNRLAGRSRNVACAALALLLASCGGGSSNTPAEPGPPAAPTLTVQSTFKSTTYQFGSEWNARYAQYDANTLEFLQAPPLSAGTIFVLNGQAYRATSVANTAPFLVGVERPTLPEVYETLIIDGQWDMSDVQEPAAGTTGARERTQARESPATITTAREGEHQGLRASGSHTLPMGLTLGYNLFGGGRAFFTDFNVFTGTGSVELEVAVKGEGTMGFERGASWPPTDEDGNFERNNYCGAPQNTKNRFRLVTLRMATPLPGGFFLSVPICLSFEGRVNRPEFRGGCLV